MLVKAVSTTVVPTLTKSKTTLLDFLTIPRFDCNTATGYYFSNIVYRTRFNIDYNSLVSHYIDVDRG